MQLLQSASQSGTRRAHRIELTVLLERLWRTGEILIEKPTVADERRNVLNYLRDVLPDVVPELDRRLKNAWERAGLPMAALATGPGVPSLRFGTWVGGDRDGHPGVTAEVTAETLERLRANALVVLHRQLNALAERLPLSEWIQPAPSSLSALRDQSVALLGDAARPSWAPNSRTLVFTRRTSKFGPRKLSLLDWPTGHVKDVAQVAGSGSQPSWSR
jgi:phosphoenolpyruvate carboxylase